MVSREKLLAAIKRTSAGPNILVSDCDRTLLTHDCGEAFLAYLCRNKLLKDGSLLPGKTSVLDETYHKRVFERYWGLVDQHKHQEAYEFCATVLSGYASGEIRALVTKTVAYENEKPGKRHLFGREIDRGLQPLPAMLAMFKKLAEDGFELWLVSASPLPVVEAVCEIYSLPVKRIIGMQTTLTGGRYTKILVRPTPTYDGKVSCIENQLEKDGLPRNWSLAAAFGDSANDRKMLERADVRIVVDRGNELSNYGKEKGEKNKWFVINV